VGLMLAINITEYHSLFEMSITTHNGCHLVHLQLPFKDRFIYIKMSTSVESWHYRQINL